MEIVAGRIVGALVVASVGGGMMGAVVGRYAIASGVSNASLIVFLMWSLFVLLLLLPLLILDPFSMGRDSFDVDCNKFERDSLERGVCAARVWSCAPGITLAMIGMFFVGCTVQGRSLVRAPRWGRFNAVRDGTEASEALLQPANAPFPDLGNLALSRVSTR